MTEIFDTNRPRYNMSLLGSVGEKMGNFFSFGRAISDDEISLEIPDETEATDLRRHAERCAFRYKIVRRGQQSQDSRLSRIEFLLAAIFLLALISKIGMVDGLKGLFGM